MFSEYLTCSRCGSTLRDCEPRPMAHIGGKYLTTVWLALEECRLLSQCEKNWELILMSSGLPLSRACISESVFLPGQGSEETQAIRSTGSPLPPWLFGKCSSSSGYVLSLGRDLNLRVGMLKSSAQWVDYSFKKSEERVEPSSDSIVRATNIAVFLRPATSTFAFCSVWMGEAILLFVQSSLNECLSFVTV